MKQSAANRKSMMDAASALARWILGAVFVYTGLNKALQPVDFLKLVREYDLVQNYFFLNSIAAVLPWLEIFFGLLLLAGIAVRGTALLLALMLTSLTSVVFFRALNIMSLQAISFCAVKFNCGCGTGEVFICHKLLENGGLILLSLWVLFSRGEKLCLRHSL